MKNLLFRILAIAIVLNGPGICQTIPEFPTSEDPEEFSRQAEEFLVQTIRSGIGFRNEYEPERRAPIDDDKRDWETVLVRIIGDPSRQSGQIEVKDSQ